MAKALKVIKVAAGSFSLCLLLCFVAFEIFLEYCPSKDLQFLGPNQLKDRPVVLTKLNNYEKDHPARPTVMFVGSSLAQYACGLCDWGQYGSPDLNKEFAGYRRFRYFDKLIAAAKDQGEPLETANLSNSGTMLSEDFLIIKEVFRKKNPPRAVILEIGPRDFIDNMTPEPYRSRLAQVLSKRQEPFNWRSDRPTCDNLDMAAEKLSLFYSMKGELHDCLVRLVCDQTHHPASIYQASLMAKLAPTPEIMAKIKNSAKVSAPSPGNSQAKVSSGSSQGADAGKDTGEMKFGHLDDCAGSEALKAFSESEYHGRYLPLNTKKWPVEIGCLKKIVAFCRAKNVPLIVVNMPLTERNLKILPADFLALYENTIAKICSPAPGDGNLVFINLRHDKRFVLDDFRDTAHMRSTGGKKLADLLAPEIVNRFSAKMAGKKDLRHFAQSRGHGFN